MYLKSLIIWKTKVKVFHNVLHANPPISSITLPPLTYMQKHTHTHTHTHTPPQFCIPRIPACNSTTSSFSCLLCLLFPVFLPELLEDQEELKKAFLVCGVGRKALTTEDYQGILWLKGKEGILKINFVLQKPYCHVEDFRTRKGEEEDASNTGSP